MGHAFPTQPGSHKGVIEKELWESQALCEVTFLTGKGWATRRGVCPDGCCSEFELERTEDFFLFPNVMRLSQVGPPLSCLNRKFLNFVHCNGFSM